MKGAAPELRHSNKNYLPETIFSLAHVPVTNMDDGWLQNKMIWLHFWEAAMLSIFISSLWCINKTRTEQFQVFSSTFEKCLLPVLWLVQS